MRLSNPSESLGNVKKPEKYRVHGTRIEDLLGKDEANAIRRAVR
ncbi:MAG TPA: hypothetical protein VN039_05495 [Nitrospira sp.]|nr:hypothetical protein [Nitrospira sp.]